MFLGEEQQCGPGGKGKQALAAPESPGQEAGARDWESACVSSVIQVRAPGICSKDLPPRVIPRAHCVPQLVKLSKQSSFDQPE